MRQCLKNQIFTLGWVHFWRLHSHSRWPWLTCADWHLSPWKLFCGPGPCRQCWNCVSVFLSKLKISVIRVNISNLLQTKRLCLCETMKPGRTSWCRHPWARLQLAGHCSPSAGLHSWASCCGHRPHRTVTEPAAQVAKLPVSVKTKQALTPEKMNINQANSYKNVWTQHVVRGAECSARPDSPGCRTCFGHLQAQDPWVEVVSVYFLIHWTHCELWKFAPAAHLLRWMQSDSWAFSDLLHSVILRAGWCYFQSDEAAGLRKLNKLGDGRAVKRKSALPSNWFVVGLVRDSFQRLTLVWVSGSNHLVWAFWNLILHA